MQNSKEKCKELKKVRKELADKLGIDLQQTECTFKGECKGTCLKCKKEEELLNKNLLQKVAIVGVAASLTLGLTACTPDDSLAGDVEISTEIKDDTTKEIDFDIVGNIEEIPEDIIVPENDSALSGDVEYIDD